MNFSTSLALGFILLVAVMFFLLVIQNWPGLFFHDPENNLAYKIQDYDGVWFKCTRAEWLKDRERKKSTMHFRSKILPGSLEF